MRVLWLLGASLLFSTSFCFAWGRYLNDYDNKNGTYTPDLYGLGRGGMSNARASNQAERNRYTDYNTSSPYYDASFLKKGRNSPDPGDKYDFWRGGQDALK